MGKCMTAECVNEYMERLSSGIAEYMALPVSQRSVEALDSMVEAYGHIKTLSEMLGARHEMTDEDLREWCSGMKNSDGTTGGHWTVEETNLAGRPADISPHVWNATMNMIYSDYYGTAERYMLNTADFYASLAKDFLYDRDGKSPTEKLAAYYNSVVK